MQELEKILYELEKRIFTAEVYNDDFDGTTITNLICLGDVRDILEKHMNDGWIPVEERLPECEEEVFIQTERGTRTTALYEDGTMREEDSIWNWCDIDGDWDEERDCMIIPKGWWEYRHFNPDDVYNNVVDEKVVAWRSLPESYRPEQPETCKYTEGSCCWPVDQCGECPKNPGKEI